MTLLDPFRFVLTALVCVIASCEPPKAPVGPLDVIVDPLLTRAGAMSVGENRDAPIPGESTWVLATRDPDGDLLVEVHFRRKECSFSSFLRLHDSPAGKLAATASARSRADSGSTWPYETMRGSVTVNQADLRGELKEPLILSTELTGRCSGSDCTMKHTVVVTEADLR